MESQSGSLVPAALSEMGPGGGCGQHPRGEAHLWVLPASAPDEPAGECQEAGRLIFSLQKVKDALVTDGDRIAGCLLANVSPFQ